MTSVPKTTIVADNSDLVATQIRNAADVIKATNSNRDNIRQGYSSVSTNDLNVKHLEDALVAGANITITKNNPAGDETLTIAASGGGGAAAAVAPQVTRVDNDTLVVGTGVNDTQTNLDLATAGNWIGGASLESASEFVHVYEEVDTPGTYKMSDKQPQYSAGVAANRIATMQVNQAGWVGTSGNGLNATSVIYDNGTTGDAVAAGNYALIYSDSIYTLGRGRSSGASSAVGNLSVARITATTAGAATGTLTFEAGHQIAINDDDWIVVIDAGKIEYRFDSSTWYKWIGAWWNDASSNLIDLTPAFGSKRQYGNNVYIADEGADYTTSSLSFVDLDPTNMVLDITTRDEKSIEILFTGAGKHSLTNATIWFDVVIDGVQMNSVDGILLVSVVTIGNGMNCGFKVIKTGLPPGTHTVTVQWKVLTGTSTIWAGAGVGLTDLHPQFSIREI